MSGIYFLNGNPLTAVYQKSGSPSNQAYDLSGNRISFDHSFLDDAIVTSLPSISLVGVKQGGCTDGTYIYQMCFDSTALETGKILKYRISDGSYTTKSFNVSDIPFGHGNDMAFNPNNGRIYVCTMDADGSVIVLNSSDLSCIGVEYLKDANNNPFNVRQICFNRENNCFYASADAVNLFVFDQQFAYQTAVVLPTHPDATHQSMETDGEYFYRLTYNPNYIDVATVDGDYVKTINLTISGEPESIMYNWSNGEFYVGTYAASNFFSKVKLTDG